MITKKHPPIKVDDGIPYPSRESVQDRYPFGKMQLNQSFFFEPQDDKEFKAVSSAASRYGKKHNKLFSLRREGKGFRVWRIR